jgi:hypothetical protein
MRIDSPEGLAEARQLYLAAIALAPAREDYHLNLARVLMMQSNYPGARSILGPLLARGSSSNVRSMAREYLAMADRLLHPPHPCLVAVGGLSGSGKSTLALSLAPTVGAVPGAVVLRSDETRKHLCGVPLLQHLGPRGYSSQVSDRVYSSVAELADLILRAGHSVVVDAVYARQADRRVIEQVAEAASVPFIGLWLEAPESVLIERAARRRGDASDANDDVIRLQRTQDTGDIGWYRLDASGPTVSVLSSATDRVMTLSRSRQPPSSSAVTAPPLFGSQHK